MKFEMCMKFECKNCKRKSKCFKEGLFYKYSENKHREDEKDRRDEYEKRKQQKRQIKKY